MSFFRLFLIFAVVIIAFTSCEYSPTGSNFHNIDSSFTPPIVNIQLPEPGQTIMIQDNIGYNLIYALNGDVSKLYKVLFYIDTSLIFESRSSMYLISMLKRTDKLLEEHVLRMIVINHSGTGSLADKLGMEGTYTERTWKLQIYNPNLFIPDSASYTIEDGILKLNWKKYPFDNFIRAEISKIFYEDNVSKNHNLVPVTDKETNWCYDRSYVGEQASYQIKLLYSVGSDILTFSFPEVSVPKDLPVFTFKKVDNSSIEVFWTKNKFYNSIASLTFSNTKLFPNFSVDSKYQSTIIKDLPLGSTENINVALVPNDSYNFSWVSVSVPVFTGDPSFKYLEFEARNGDNIYYLQNSTGYTYSFKLYKYSLSADKILDSVSLSTQTSRDNRVAISPSGKNIVYRTGNDLACCLNGDISHPKIITDLQLTGKSSNYGFDCQAISDNGILVAGLSGVYVYDLINDKLVCTMPANSPSELNISANGDYIALTNSGTITSKIYKIENGSAKMIIDGFVGYNFQFDNNINSKVYYYDVDNKSMKYLDCSSNVNTYMLSSFLIYLDLESGRAIRNIDSKNNEILDINNGLQSIYKYKSNNGSGYIKGDYIYFSSGLKCKLR